MPRLAESLADTPVVVLQGARQTGKSTLVGDLGSRWGGLVVTLDDSIQRAAARADPETFLRQAPGRLMVIDEIQRVPELILAAKAEVDRDRRPGRFLLTGSADLLRVPGAEDSLAGRAETLELAPLSQGEIESREDDLIAKLWNNDLSVLAGWTTRQTRDDLVQRIVRGGLPESVSRHGRRRSAWLRDYARRLVRRDARELARTPPERLARALALLAANQSGELVAAQLAGRLGVSAPTASSDVAQLQALYLVDVIPSWSRSHTQRLVGRTKAFVVDSGLCATLNRLDEGQLLSPLGLNHLGPALEGFVAAELTRQRTWSEEDFELSHFRESGGAEVDLVITGPAGSVLGIEVKATTSITMAHFAGLARFRRRVGDQFRGGIVLYAGQQALSFGPGLLALPVSALWEL